MEIGLPHALVDRYPVLGYQLPEEVTIEPRGPAAWAVVYSKSYVLHRSGSWLPEPLPSNRTDAFIETTRQPTAQEAYELFTSFYPDAHIDSGPHPYAT